MVMRVSMEFAVLNSDENLLELTFGGDMPCTLLPRERRLPIGW